MKIEIIRTTARLCGFMLTAAMAVSCADFSEDKNPASNGDRLFIINEDDSRFLSRNSVEDMTREYARAYIDKLKDSKVTHFFICRNAQRAMFRSGSRQAIWEDSARGERCYDYVRGHRWVQKWIENAKYTEENGLELGRIWIEKCREVGISPWISMRMNDMHCPNIPDYIGHDRFWLDNPQFRRVPKYEKGKPWDIFALNYKNKEVRDYQLSFVRELFERYDFDGLELDWMRFSLHLTPGKGEEDSPCLDEFMREVKALAKEYGKKRGRKIGVAVRVHATPDAAKYAGLNVEKWAREGLVDIVIPSSAWISDFDIPVSEWKKALADSPNVKIIPGAEHGTAGGLMLPRMSIDLPMLNGWIANAKFNGANGFYFFNLIYFPEIMQKAAERGLDAVNSPRRHPLSYRDLIEARSNSDRNIMLPKNISEGKTENFKILFGLLPQKIGDGDISAVAGIDRISGKIEIGASLNGVPAVRQEPETRIQEYGGGSKAVRFFFPKSAVKEGYNELSLVGKSGKCRVVWLELDYAVGGDSRK